MPNKMYLYLLIICGIWSREITEIFADKEIRESSDILFRQKRVLNHRLGEDQIVNIHNFPYVVKIKQNTRFRCVGSILSNHVVITIYLCATYEAHQYHVVAGSIRVERGTIHDVTDIKKRVISHPNRSLDGIALLTVYPPFVYVPSVSKIELHSEPLLPGMEGTISGWGYDFRNDRVSRGTCYPRSLRSIVVPILAHRDCVNRYQHLNIEITDSDICTYHSQKHCGHTDEGAPLVVDGYLVGVHLWTGPNRSLYNPDYPEVFALVQHSEYNQWIRSNI